MAELRPGFRAHALFLIPFSLSFFFLVFLDKKDPRHMKMSWLAVRLELQPLAYATATATWIQATSAAYRAAHSNAGSLIHWARPGIKPAHSWIRVGFEWCDKEWMRRAIREASLRRRHWRKAPDAEHRERAGRAVGTAKGQRPDGRRQVAGEVGKTGPGGPWRPGKQSGWKGHIVTEVELLV